jgi:hypothetical protein
VVTISKHKFADVKLFLVELVHHRAVINGTVETAREDARRGRVGRNSNDTSVGSFKVLAWHLPETSEENQK